MKKLPYSVGLGLIAFALIMMFTKKYYNSNTPSFMADAWWASTEVGYVYIAMFIAGVLTMVFASIATLRRRYSKHA